MFKNWVLEVHGEYGIEEGHINEPSSSLRNDSIRSFEVTSEGETFMEKRGRFICLRCKHTTDRKGRAIGPANTHSGRPYKCGGTRGVKEWWANLEFIFHTLICFELAQRIGISQCGLSGGSR